MTVELRPAQVTDLPVIAAIYTENWQHTYKQILPEAFLQAMNPADSEKQWAKFLATQETTLLVAMAEG